MLPLVLRAKTLPWTDTTVAMAFMKISCNGWARTHTPGMMDAAFYPFGGGLPIVLVDK
jgi:hypothetical protein